ncbi:ATP-binding cassette domain-containing protein [bacterium]|jgi:phospholipid/cholesterol/gamma-HCH transport system ATP-binding protein|nr:ATP-binding cassette domain-containing protein [bacterium]
MIKLSNINKSFDETVILKNLDLSIGKGEIIAIIGPSGCGKSTLLRLIMGLHRPDSGSVVIDGDDIVSMRQKELNKVRLKMGLLFQSGALFDSLNVEENVGFTLKENLKLSNEEIKFIVNQKLDLVEMSGRGNDNPSDLSGGQQKRIGLARAIAADPQIILYDEPTTGLDPILSTNIENLIVKLNKDFGMTSVIVTHQISTILRVAEKIYLLKDNKLLPPETPDSIYDSSYEEYRQFIRGGLKT